MGSLPREVAFECQQPGHVLSWAALQRKAPRVLGSRRERQSETEGRGTKA